MLTDRVPLAGDSEGCEQTTQLDGVPVDAASGISVVSRPAMDGPTLQLPVL